MKVLITFLFGLLIATPTAYAQNKALEKALKKEYKTKMKEYGRSGWKIFGTSRSLDVALLTHYDKLTMLGDDGTEIVGIASNVKSKNVGHQVAINNACNTYAQIAGSHVKGRIVSDMAQNADDANMEFDKFYAAYERLVDKEIKGELKESYTVIREVKTGLFEMQTYFIVNEEAATNARIRAMENAFKETQAAQKYADKISEFVREGFREELISHE